MDRLRTDNGSFLILCTDASGKNSSAGRILEITKGKDYGELQYPDFPEIFHDIHNNYSFQLERSSTVCFVNNKNK